MTNIKSFIAIIFLFLSSGLYAQELQQLYNNINLTDNDSLKIENSHLFAKALKSELLSNPNALSEEYANLNIGKVISDDKKLRIFSWNYKLSNDEGYAYEAIFYYKPNKKTKASVYHIYTNNGFKPKDNKKYRSNNWYGSLYYKVIKFNKQYFLLGYASYNSITKVKLIDILTIGSKNLEFGSNIIYSEKKAKYRLCFEYSAEASMALSYDFSKKQFVFDHLSPKEAHLKGLYQYYGPDFSVDVLKLKKKKLILIEDNDIRNKE